MAFTKAQLEALKNTLLASNQPILASQHRQQVQGLIDEMYDAQSRGNILVGVQSDSVQGSSDTFLVFRSGQAYQLPLSIFSGGRLDNLADVFITDLQDGQTLVYDSVSQRWNNFNLNDLFITPQQLSDAIDGVQLFVGYFSTENDLNLLFPPEDGGVLLDGSWALVGTDTTFQHYDWDKTSEQWKAIQGQQGPPGVVDLNALDLRYLRRDIAQTVTEQFTIENLILTDAQVINNPIAYLGVLIDGTVKRVNIATVTGDKNFVFNQGTASSTWNIAHNLNKLPSVTIQDSANNMVLGSLNYVDLNNITITFSSAISGRAILN
jgi:hypothetical protein